MLKLISLLFLLTVLITLTSYTCEETVTIDSVKYKVTGRWCGLALDSSMIAVPESLVQLPESLTFEDSRIYVRRSTCDAFVKMAKTASKDGIKLIADSGYRSGSYQKRIIKKRMAEGATFEQVIRFVAPPGYSEHETGYALDLVPSEARFAHTKTYKWLKNNAHKFGFFETIPKDNTGKTFWESWHWMYKTGK